MHFGRIGAGPYLSGVPSDFSDILDANGSYVHSYEWAHLGPIPSVESPHPSPLSASRGFFGSRPFSRVNQLLVERGGQPIDWALPA